MNKVWVLGAGSSAAAGAPITKNFKEAAALALRKTVSRRGSARLAEALDFWDRAVPSADIEQFYILADLLERLGVTTTDYPAMKFPLLESVKYLIAKTLDVRMGGEVSPFHQHFFEAIHSPKIDNTVISLNWDIALDHGIIASYGPEILDYGYSNARPMTGSPRDPDSPTFKVLKLHGSTNWYYCKNGSVLWYAGDKKAIIPYWESELPIECPEPGCQEKLQPLMVPPTSQKLDSSDFVPVLTELWKGAREAIAKCDQLACVGYSFPATDIQFRMLVNEALNRNEKLQKIAVVTSAKYGTEKQEFENHYAKMFEGCRHQDRLSFRYFSFERWVEEEKTRLHDASALD